LIVAAALVSAGCGHHESPKPEISTPPVTGGFASRLAAARAISDSDARDSALSQLAVDAAAGGDGETANLAVVAIGSTDRKDQAASRAALNLAQVGKGDEANKVALLIGSMDVRDQTLARIAKGEFGK
jgi:hypothetical protein